MKDESRAAIEGINRLDPRERVAFALGALLASPPELVEAEAAELPDHVAQVLAALLLAPQVRRQVVPVEQGPEAS